MGREVLSRGRHEIVEGAAPTSRPERNLSLGFLSSRRGMPRFCLAYHGAMGLEVIDHRTCGPGALLDEEGQVGRRVVVGGEGLVR